MPEVVTGQRSGTDYPDRTGPNAVFDNPVFIPDSIPDVVKRAVWISRYRHYRVSFTARRDSVINGETIRAENNDVRFDDHTLTLNLNDPKQLEQHQRLLKSEWHGLNRHFWLREEQEAAERQARVKQLQESLADPVVMEDLRAALGSKDFADLKAVRDVMVMNGQAPSMDASDADLEPEPEAAEPSPVAQALASTPKKKR